MNDFVSFKDVVYLIAGSTGMISLLLLLLNKMLRASILSEVIKSEEKTIAKLDAAMNKQTERSNALENEIDTVKSNYLKRFEEQKDLIIANKELAQKNHEELLRAIERLTIKFEYYARGGEQYE